MQNQTGRSHRHSGVVNAKATLDLIIVDVPEGHLVLFVSTLVDVVPLWNKSTKSFLEGVFVFAKDYFQDGAIIVIHLY
jgi:hypothetical protein